MKSSHKGWFRHCNYNSTLFCAIVQWFFPASANLLKPSKCLKAAAADGVVSGCAAERVILTSRLSSIPPNRLCGIFKHVLCLIRTSGQRRTKFFNWHFYISSSKSAITFIITACLMCRSKEIKCKGFGILCLHLLSLLSNHINHFLLQSDVGHSDYRLPPPFRPPIGGLK